MLDDVIQVGGLESGLSQLRMELILVVGSACTLPILHLALRTTAHVFNHPSHLLNHR